MILMQQATSAQQARYDPRLVVDFDVPAEPTAETARRIDELLNGATVIQRLGPLTIDLQQRTATLRGEVATVNDRELARALVELEPGVSSVVNQIRVAEPAE